MADRVPVILSELLTDEKVADDLRSILDQCSWEVEFDDQPVTVPRDLATTVVERVYFERSEEIGFGSHYRVVVAIGGLESIEHGIVIPKICFSLLYYSLDREVITSDFMPTNWWVR